MICMSKITFLSFLLVSSFLAFIFIEGLYIVDYISKQVAVVLTSLPTTIFIVSYLVYRKATNIKK